VNLKKNKPEEQKYNVIDHEADIGLEVYGKSLEELFINAVKGLFSLIVDAKDVQPEKGKRFDTNGNGETLIVFLNELLYMWDVEGFIPKEFSLKIDNNRLTGTVIGGIFDPAKHTAKQEVKAVTYHGFSITQNKNGFKARIIMDV
jgi:SHS2 domain-containing protein